MTKEKLLKALNEAESKNQIGILIWSSWTTWDKYSFEMETGNEMFDRVLSQLNNGISSTNYFSFMGLKMVGFLAIHVNTALSSKKLFNEILRAFNTGLYQGPISLIPNNETLEV